MPEIGNGCDTTAKNHQKNIAIVWVDSEMKSRSPSTAAPCLWYDSQKIDSARSMFYDL